MGENEYRISLGVQVETDDIKSQINTAEAKLDPIKIKVDAETKELANTIKTALKSLTDGTKNALTLNTDSLEASLKDVSASIKDIKTSLGTLDSKSGMKNLLTSINQISSALERASNQFESLNANLNALSGKDLSLNFGINMGGSNQIGRNAAYGQKVRGETLPELKKQVNALVGYYNAATKESADSFQALLNLVSGTKFGNGDFLNGLITRSKDSLFVRMSDGSLASQMQAYKEYIDMFKQAASLKGLDLSSVTSQFSKSADQLVQDAVDIQTGAKEMEDGFEKLKQVFGGGSNLNIEGISAQLEPIIKDLNEIREAVVSLSKGISIEGLTASFDKLSNSIEQLVKNCTNMRTAINDSVGGLGSSVGQASGGLAGVENIAQEFKEADIKIKATEDQIANLGRALRTVGFNDSSVESLTNDFKELGVTVTNVTSRLNGDGSVKLSVKGLDQYKNAVTAINNIGKDGSRSAWSTTISRDIEEVVENFNKLKSLAQEIGNLKIDIFKSNDADDIRNMTIQLYKLQNEYNELFASAHGGLSSSQIGQLDSITKNAETKLSNLKKKHAETRAEFAKGIEIKLNAGKFSTEVKLAHSNAKQLSKVSDELRIKLDALDDAERAMNLAFKDGSVEERIRAYNEYRTALEVVENQLKQNKIAENDANNLTKLNQQKQAFSLEMSNWLKDNSAAAKQFSARIKELQSQISACDDTGLGNLRREFQNIKKEAQAAGKTTKTFGDKIKSQFSQYSAYFSVASVFMYAEQALRSMFEQVKLIDSAMTELKKVTNETDESYNQFLSNAASRAKELGTTIDGLVSSTADFAKLGYGFEDSQELAEVANIYAVVGDEINGVEDATKSLVSTLAAFKDEMNGMSDSDFAMSIVDKFNEVSNNFAISSGGIGEALQRSASSLNAANNTIDESIALITAANTVVQDPVQVGKVMPTLKVAISVKLLRRTRPRKDFVSIFDIHQLGRMYVFLINIKEVILYQQKVN